MYRLPDSLEKEIEDFFIAINEYKQGEMNPVMFKGIRVVHGVYEQRTENMHMMRVRCASGQTTPRQFRTIAEIAEKYASGFVHITTRQEIQIHDVDIDAVPNIVKELKKAGLSTRGGGGNTVRNIIASHDSGINPEEVFDVTPYSNELTTQLIAESDSWKLPRKFKISFSSSPKDNIKATLTDLGFIATQKNRKKGFKVYCAGGLGNKAEQGKVLLDFIPDTHVYHVAKALKLMFDKNGNRRQKHHSRIRFLWNDLSEKVFKLKFLDEYNTLLKEKGKELKIKETEYIASVNKNYSPISNDTPEFILWKKRYVTKQKQEGLFQVSVPLKFGDISSKDIYKLTKLLENFGDNCLRYTVKQNIHLINIPEEYLANVFETIKTINTYSFQTPMFGNMVACTGADTCKLGICLPKGLVSNIERVFDEKFDTLEELADFNINISGCPNSCGCHQTADLGFFGRVIKKGGEMMPAYSIVAGGVLEDGKTKIAEKITEIPAKDVPEFVKEFLSKYKTVKSKYKTFNEYLQDSGKEDILKISSQFKPKAIEESPEYYFDWGAHEKFSVLKGQKAECSAGMFDMIEVDINMMENHKNNLQYSDYSKKNEILHKIVFLACRMLLVTRGIEPRGTGIVYKNFLQHFIKTGIVPDEYQSLIEKVAGNANTNILADSEKIIKLSELMVELYKGMDDSLKFNIEKMIKSEKEIQVSQNNIRKKDLRGVACPMNFVKTKIELSTMNKGEFLEILLDDGQPIQNVPNSVKLEGHSVLSVKNIDNYWSVLIQKA
ncbi:MAG: sulfurtransferase TusA family protein [Bacteroidales bacterium]|nr:sulfurtransferase TusA family protein [Bacteroidales bacterium]